MSSDFTEDSILGSDTHKDAISKPTEIVNGVKSIVAKVAVGNTDDDVDDFDEDALLEPSNGDVDGNGAKSDTHLDEDVDLIPDSGSLVEGKIEGGIVNWSKVSSDYVPRQNGDSTTSDVPEESCASGRDDSVGEETAVAMETVDNDSNVDKATVKGKGSEGSGLDTASKVKDTETDRDERERKTDDGKGSISPEASVVDTNADVAGSAGKLLTETDCGSVDGQGGANANIQEASSSKTPPTTTATNSTTPIIATTKSIKYRCHKCSCVTKDKRVFDNHSCEKESAGDNEKVRITVVYDKEKENLTCKECDFSNKGHGFEEHLMCHLMLRPYQCLYCKECFINRREISRHVLKVHNGAKMSCALRALKRAKGIIKEASESGSHHFMARVGGKVPLDKDPARKKERTGGESDNAEGSGEKADPEKNDSGSHKKTKSNSGSDEKEATSQLEERKSLKESNNITSESGKQEMESDQRSISSANIAGNDLNNGEGEEEIKSPTHPDTEKPSFSKLREVLTSEKLTGLVRDKDSGTSPAKSPISDCDTRDNKTSNDSSGIRILASYSLNEEDMPENTSSTEGKETKKAEKAESSRSNGNVEPNFIITCPSTSPDQESETLSFLGPERPIFKPASPSQSHSIIPAVHPPTQVAQISTNLPACLPPSPQRVSVAVKPAKTSDFFVCGFDCSFSCINKTDLLQHLKDIHSSRSDFPCHYCGYRDVSEDSLVNHVAFHADSHDKTKPLYTCAHQECTYTSNMLTDFISHVKSSHPDVTTPICQACDAVCPDILSFQTHLEENIIHIVNCPHCPSKATERRAILNHITSMHPGKPKMVSVAKQLICNSRREHGYGKSKNVNEMPPPSMTPSPHPTSNSGTSSSSVIDHILRRPTSNLGDQGDVTPESGHSPMSDSSVVRRLRVKEEVEEETTETGDTGGESSTYIVDEHGVRRRIYVPMSERHAENFRCNYCTFVARDVKRLACHERSHGMPPTRKDRFKCMFCPQGFDSELKFRLHITCHPGLIKFLLYKCKKCEFDSNQKHTIVKHITCNRDKKHRGIGPVENQYTIISRSLESRVLECERCDYMTRHKIHMAIHYQREHGILRDKSDFTIEGLTPHDTPFSGTDTTTMPAISSPFERNVMSPVDLSKRPTYKKSKFGTEPTEPGGMSLSEIHERNELFNRLVSQQSALQPGNVLENQARKFKCPICKYLLPKAADLKTHVKRHSEAGQITLVMFRCKYCSCMSTARELLYEHLGEKHPGKPIALVKKIVFIDTAEADRSFAETAVEENLQQLEESVHNEIMSAINSNVSSSKSSTKSKSPSPSPSPSGSFEQLFVIPEGGETFPAALHCPKCPFSSHSRQEIIYHVTSTHPEVKVISSDEDVEKLAKATTKDLHRSKSPKCDDFKPEIAKPSTIRAEEEVLIVPDDLVFKEPALCSRCEYGTTLRKDMVSHLQQCHPEIHVMGRNSYPIQVSAIGNQAGLEPADDSCIVGSGNLDNKLKCLYENHGAQMKCLICGVSRPKKFFIHVHILRHLNVFLWKCSFCVHRGLQKYKMVDHIKKIHPGKPMSVRYLPVNVEAKVSQFLSQFDLQYHRSETAEGSNSNMLGLGDKEDSCGSAEGVPCGDFHDSDNNDTEKMLVQSSSGSTYVLGCDELDAKISCLYEQTPNQFYSCQACINQFQRKFAIHRHIVITHLKVALLSCAYCGMQGVEKHQMVDHNLACHASQPVSFHNNTVDLDRSVSDFLSESCHLTKMGKLSDSEKTELIQLMKSWNNSSNKKSGMYKNVGPDGVRMKRPYTKRSQSAWLGSGKKTTGNRSKTIVDPGVVMLGREALDKELNCLYQARGGGQFRCLICRWEFPRKYPLHRHIMLKHLRMNLVACPYCDYEGVEKYTVSAHIKEEHKDHPVSIRYVQPDVGVRVRHFVEDMASGISTSQDLIRRPNSALSTSGAHSSSASSLSALVKMKREKSFDELAENRDNNDNFEEEDDDDDDDDDGDESERDRKDLQSSSSQGQGLVVAMFGKKSSQNDNSSSNRRPEDDIVVKTEVEDEEYEEGSKLDDHNEEDGDEDNLPMAFSGSSGIGDGGDEDDDVGGGDDDDDDDDGQGHRDTFIDEEEMERAMDEGEGDTDGSKVDRDSRIRAIRASFIKSRSFSTLRRPLMQAYAPGSYRSPSGGKPKALDVITKIKVLKSREGPITKFCCEKCTFSSVHRSNVVRHIYKIHERYQTHVCPICNYQTLSLILMQTHMGKAHPGVEYTDESFAINPPRSKPRSKPLMGPLSFQQRRRSKPRTPYDFGHSSVSSSSSAPADSTAKLHSGPKQYACAYCHYETNTQNDILTHTREKHTDTLSEYAKSDTTIGEHSHGAAADRLAMSGPTPDACWEKSKKAVKRKMSEATGSGLIRSKRKFVFEKGEELIQCGYCDVRETSMGRMQHHLEWEHPGEQFSCKRIPAWRFVCSTCSVKTMATSKMKYHLNRHVNYRPYTCVNCGAFFPSPDQCRRHSRTARHEEQYVYIHNTKKEQRVEDLLQKTRQLALKIQEDAANDPGFDISTIDTFLSRYQDTKHNLKRSAKSGSRSKKAKVADDGEKAAPKRPPAKSAQTLGIEMDVTIQCFHCKFESNTVHQVLQHHDQEHAKDKFLWTEVERGFTCDRSGEAILDSSSFPHASEEVGYSTKMTLGVGSKNMSFKCKNCDFSSCVIQAMKSHLKSHQPKGFICPYCSRSFSGKEKLMRHQYCLHKGMPIWVIHLRKASAATLASAKQWIPQASTRSIKDDDASTSVKLEPDDQPETFDENPSGAAISSMPVCYVCNKCPFRSDSLLKYRRHLASDHKEFRRKIKVSGSELLEDVGEVSTSETQNGYDVGSENGDDVSKTDNSDESRGFKCGHCEFSASEKKDIEEHHTTEHGDEELVIIDLGEGKRELLDDGERSTDVRRGLKRKGPELLLDLEPRVKVKRMSSSTLADYDDGDENSDDFEEGEGNDGGDLVEGCVDLEEGEHSGMFSDNEASAGIEGEEDDGEFDDEEDDDEVDDVLQNKKLEIRRVGDDSEIDDAEGSKHKDDDGISNRQSLKYKIKFPRMMKNGGDDDDDDNDNDEEEGEEEELTGGLGESDVEDDDDEEDDYNTIVSSPLAEDSEELARQLGLTDGQPSSMLGSEDSGMMIMEFNGMRPGAGGASAGGGDDSRGSVSNDAQEDNKDNNEDREIADDDEDEDDDEEDVEFDDVNLTLTSPLPMISLGDGMDMSPGMLPGSDGVEAESRAEEEDSPTDRPEALLDV